MEINQSDVLAASEMGAMTFAQAEQIFAMAQAEGWNPGKNDLKCAWELDPQAFVALRYHGAMIAGGSILKHSPAFGFMGLFIVLDAYRGLGLGRLLWHERLRRLRARLAPDATIGMDGVFQMEPFYAAGGFAPHYETIRYQGIAKAYRGETRAASLVIRTTASADTLLAYDRTVTPYDRTNLLALWLGQSEHLIAAAFQDDMLIGFALARPAQSGFKIGPLLADNPVAARELLRSLMDRLEGEQVQIDVPAPNPAGVPLVSAFGLVPNFGCRRMYFGQPLPADMTRVFGAMSLEFG